MSPRPTRRRATGRRSPDIDRWGRERFQEIGIADTDLEATKRDCWNGRRRRRRNGLYGVMARFARGLAELVAGTVRVITAR